MDLARSWKTLRKDGLRASLSRRLRWYSDRIRVNNPVVGRIVELLGYRVRLDGLIFSVDTPMITRPHKSTLVFGLHEMEERELVKRWLPPDLPVLEFGGGLGVVSCLVNRRVKDPTRHIVVEANPAMVPVLRSNRDRNGCKFTIINKAVAYGRDEVELAVDSEFVGSRVGGATSTSSVAVRTTTARALLDEAGFDQAALICDIEGTEADLVSQEIDTLAHRVRFIMAELHPAVIGDEATERLQESLRSVGFALREQIGDCVVYTRA